MNEAYLRLLGGPDAGLTALDRLLYGWANSLAGRSWGLDTLVALSLDNGLVKAGVIGACFIYAWHRDGGAAEVARRRTILLVTLLASLLVIATTKTLAGAFFAPRPFVQSQAAFYLEGGRLVEAAPLAHRVPLDKQSQAQFHALRQGDLVHNDMGSFPSDHAGFFMTLAFGIFLASRRAGAVAIAWTLLVTLGSRVVTGQHWPLDIATGALIGFAILVPLQLGARRWGSGVAAPAVGWTLRHQALASALIFLIVFEATNALNGVRSIAGLGRDVVEGALRT